MSEKKRRLGLPGAIVILSVCILFSASVISSAIRDSSNNGDMNEFELNRFNDNFEELISTIKDNNELSQ
ncbi:hypothetical protein D8M04_03760 [Oceanobacillus piezotolerans]|uniref:Uncharacterized protein n=1 Tax=Oceanobacillus piezotolerans TaxID=2448030 RepID=A0A498DIK4_9BACI|nr:hypothetical protein [Oceanobacillus piezotolerans]RLL48389.1 hypothetical protein D8M04_03760 [Oceanobacillus piezotolerans]